MEGEVTCLPLCGTLSPTGAASQWFQLLLDSPSLLSPQSQWLLVSVKTFPILCPSSPDRSSSFLVLQILALPLYFFFNLLFLPTPLDLVLQVKCPLLNYLVFF